MERAITVAIVDDHPVVVEGVRSWIERDEERRVAVIEIAATVEDLSRGLNADVILLDLRLREGMAIDLIPGLADAGHRVIAFSSSTDNETIRAAMDAGACEYVCKDEGQDHLIEAIVAVASDRPYVTPSHAKVVLDDRRPDRPELSAREQQALLLWFQGMSKASVAARMAISENTVRQYIGRVRLKYLKMGRPAPTKTTMLARAIQDGLIQPSEISEYRSFAAEHPAP
ncbi:response regulator transcription factor [Microbispora sp. NPDC088329]|uniref:response regulator transcription factor n=1 Tax=Microbispora sp. NPDC088329 TaxID=3154869 RepID=UPI0034342EB6